MSSEPKAGTLFQEVCAGLLAEAADPHGLEEQTQFAPDELAALIGGHIPEGRFDGDDDEIVDEIEEAITDPLNEVKVDDDGVTFIRDAQRGRTIIVNPNRITRSTAINETRARWNAR
ncbi:MAG TPA: hypothetical protein VFU19_11800 [Iamia sp.]|nr:hypothetical protein [Iamia sp.]